MAADDTEENTPLAVLADIGAAGQAVVPGAYAWAVTVAPAAWSRAADAGVKAAAILAIASLLSTLLKTKGPIATWVFVLASTVVWVAVPSAMSPAHLHPARGIAGMLGWGVFAFATAAPALGPSKRGPATEGGLEPRVPLPRGDAVYLGIGFALAAALQFVGWSILIPERAVFVRLLTVASGIAIVGVATVLATSRHHSSSAPRPTLGRALRKSIVLVISVALLLAMGILHALAGKP